MKRVAKFHLSNFKVFGQFIYICKIVNKNIIIQFKNWLELYSIYIVYNSCYEEDKMTWYYVAVQLCYMEPPLNLLNFFYIHHHILFFIAQYSLAHTHCRTSSICFNQIHWHTAVSVLNDFVTHKYNVYLYLYLCISMNIYRKNV